MMDNKHQYFQGKLTEYTEVISRLLIFSVLRLPFFSRKVCNRILIKLKICVFSSQFSLKTALDVVRFQQDQ